MKANRKHRTFRPDDAAVSAVIGAVLVFGLFSSAFVIWSFTTLPVWIADNEYARNEEAVSSFSSLRNGLGLLAAENSAGPITASFPLSADEVPLLQPAPSVGQISYDSGFSWSASFTSPTSYMVDGVVDGMPGTSANGGSESNVANLQVLDIAYTGGAGTSLTITATDGNGDAVTGTLAVTAGGNCSTNSLTFTATSDFTSSSRVSADCVGSLTDYRFNPLDSQHGFANQLNRLAGTFTLDFTTSTTSTYDAVYVDGNGVTQVTGSGTVCGGTECDRSITGGRIIFDPISLHAIDQTLVWEGGTIIREQGDGQTIISAPDFDLVVDGTTGHLRWTVIELGGTGALGGNGNADVVLTFTGVDERLVGTNSDGTIVIQSTYSEAWANYLDSQALVAGATANDFAVDDGTTGQVTITMDTVDDVTQWLVHYRVISATVVVGA